MPEKFLDLVVMERFSFRAGVGAFAEARTS